jgi:hypothetical protein
MWRFNSQQNSLDQLASQFALEACPPVRAVCKQCESHAALAGECLPIMFAVGNGSMKPVRFAPVTHDTESLEELLNPFHDFVTPLPRPAQSNRPRWQTSRADIRHNLFEGQAKGSEGRFAKPATVDPLQSSQQLTHGSKYPQMERSRLIRVCLHPTFGKSFICP